MPFGIGEDRLPQLWVLWYVGINVFTFLAYRIDKRKAETNNWRISEKFLLGLAVLGGGLGAYFGMRVFHHKTNKRVFKIWVPLWIIIHVVLFFQISINMNSTKDENGSAISIRGGADGPTSIFIAGKIGGEEMGYTSIPMDAALELMKNDGSHVVVDVRKPEEYEKGHIPGAINIVNEEIKEEPQELPDKEQVIYVYCRSGRRSKEAAQKLSNLGYTNVFEMGGITEYKGDLEK